jgi:hypothetical protein
MWSKDAFEMMTVAPKHYAAKIDIMFDESHPAVSWPPKFVIIPKDIVVCRVRVGTEMTLDKIMGLLGGEAKQGAKAVDIARVETNRMPDLCFQISVLQEIVWHLSGPIISLAH